MSSPRRTRRWVPRVGFSHESLRPICPGAPASVAKFCRKQTPFSSVRRRRWFSGTVSKWRAESITIHDLFECDLPTKPSMQAMEVNSVISCHNVGKQCNWTPSLRPSTVPIHTLSSSGSVSVSPLPLPPPMHDYAISFADDLFCVKLLRSFFSSWRYNLHSLATVDRRSFEDPSTPIVAFKSASPKLAFPLVLIEHAGDGHGHFLAGSLLVKAFDCALLPEPANGMRMARLALSL